jgi:hypothetical protein
MAEPGSARYHQRRRYRPLPRRDLAGVIDAFPSIRQTLAGEFDNCRLMALFGLEGYPFSTAEQARGTIFHRFMARVLKTLRETGEIEISQEEALQILREVLAQRDVPPEEVVLPPARERRLLRILAIKMATETRFTSSGILAVEETLSTTLRYASPDGGYVDRVFTGTPDAIINTPPGITIPDWKTTRKAPPRGDSKDHWDDPDHVSYEGYFQQRGYGLLGLERYQRAEWAKLREYYPLEKPGNRVRWATIYRKDLPTLREEFTDLIELMDRALGLGSRSKIWEASPGKHCSYCPKPTRCPIEEDVRIREGGIATPAQAKKAAAEYVVAKQVSGELHEALSTWCRQYGPIDVKSAKGRYQLRWKENKTGGGSQFGMHVPIDSDRGPLDPDLESAFLDAADRAAQSRDADRAGFSGVAA